MSTETKTPAKTVELNFKLGVVGSGIYLAVGILYHMIFGDYEVFSWTDPWLFVGMFLWPFLLFFRFLVVAIIVGVVGFTAWYLFVERPEERKKKRLAAERRAAFEEQRRSAARATPSVSLLDD